MAGIVRDIHAELGANMGGVVPPTLFPFVGGKMLGFAQLRPVYRGSDAATGIAEMSFLAAAGGADEVLVAWETQDIAVACELRPLHPGPGVNLLWADPEGHLLRRMPYKERLLPGRTEDGLYRAAYDWLAEEPEVEDTELEPAIGTLVQFCWEPLDQDAPVSLKGAAELLRSMGYVVDLTA